ncbi:cytochrome P450 3A41-like [Amblyomma americanum]
MLYAFLTFLVLAASSLLWWVRKTFTFWRDKGIAHLTFWQYLRFLYDIFTKPLNEVLHRNYKRYGRVYGSYQGTAPTLVVGDPDIIREVLVTKFQNFSDKSEAQRIGSDVWCKAIDNLSGDEWKTARNIFTPALTATGLRTIVVKIKTIAEKLTSRIVDAASQDEPVNLSELSFYTALDTAAALNYSIELDSKNDPNHALIRCLEGIYMNEGGWKVLMLFFMPSVFKALQPDYPRKESTDVFRAFVSHLIQERESKEKEEDDFLQVFMNADYDWEKAGNNKSENTEKKKMSLDEITAQGISFFIGGVEGGSMTLALSAYYLALHPECQDRAIAEVDKTLSEGDITYDALQQMSYLEACIKEALRICTPDNIILRLCTEETTVAGIHFKPGMCVAIPLPCIHRDSEYFAEPEKYNPDRFLLKNKASIRSFTYMPFGAGPRNCVGMRLSLMQAKVALASLLRHVRFETCSETMVPLKFRPLRLDPDFDGPLVLRAVTRHHLAN